MTKKRIDNLLVEKGLAESKTKAQAMIMAGDVLADGKVILKAGTLVSQDAEVSVNEPPPFVSRGGLKLDYALEQFGLDVRGAVVADIGASTGGFTDCLLKRGAALVYSVDVGYGQLDYRLRQDSRVIVMDRVNARNMPDIPERLDLIVIDVSFISVQKIIPAVTGLLKDEGNIIVLLKPQFEAKRDEVGKGGIIKRPEIHARVLGRFVKWITDNAYRLKGMVGSPIEGASGNREFLALIKLT
ncbi:MAG: TlyA family RNA methyltransferase [Dehalococcoidales bacterium]|nr:MAG: TlyA family RNA methyltransferase [Dehalococcoidales bacterium]